MPDFTSSHPLPSAAVGFGRLMAEVTGQNVTAAIQGQGGQAVKEYQLPLKAWEVRAILEGRKTQTRRMMKLQPDTDDVCFGWFHQTVVNKKTGEQEPGPEVYGAWWDDGQSGLRCPYGAPGDRLIVASPIPDYGDAYCAGTNGVIYSRARGDWRPLKAHVNGNGYPSVTLMVGNRKTTRTVHSLVCSAFYGPPPFDSAQVRHLDGNRGNNTPDNLVWGTQVENWADRRAHGNGINGEKHHASKLSDDDRNHVRWAVQHGLCSQRHAARALNMSQAAIGQLLDACDTQPSQEPVLGARVVPITPEVVAVRVERLQDIGEGDAYAEGIEDIGNDIPGGPYALNPADGHRYNSARDAYRALWESINGAGSWALNPYVWVVEFKRLEAKP